MRIPGTSDSWECSRCVSSFSYLQQASRWPGGRINGRTAAMGSQVCNGSGQNCSLDHAGGCRCCSLVHRVHANCRQEVHGCPQPNGLGDRSRACLKPAKRARWTGGAWLVI
jgi:hypothetical protein